MTDPRQALAAGEAQGRNFAFHGTMKVLRGTIGHQLAKPAGSSLEFKDHRDYQPGDDLRHIDWGAFARSDRLTVKVHHDELQPQIDVLLDTSASMDLPDSRKLEGTLGVVGFLSGAARRSGLRFTLWCGEAGLVPLGGSTAPTPEWDDVTLTTGHSFPEALEQRGLRLRPQGIRIVVSDLLWPSEPRRILQRVSAGGALTIVIQVLSEDEVNPARRGSVRLEDVETGEAEEVVIDDRLLAQYRANLRHHQDSWREACRSTAATFTTITAEDFVDDWHLPDLLRLGMLRPA